MEMREIYKNDSGLTISVDTETGKGKISKGGRSQDFNLPLNFKSEYPLPKFALDMVRKAGKNPADYFWGGYVMTTEAKPAFDAALDEYRSNHIKARESRENALELAVPGLAKLRAARANEARYREEFDQMMEDEGNDGVNPPVKPAVSSSDIAAQYPRAALYLKAESYSYATNDRKASAGAKAVRLLTEGGSEDDAKEILDNWLPASAYTD